MNRSSSIMAAAFLFGAIPLQVCAEPVVLSFSDGWASEAALYLFAPVSTTGTSTVAGQPADVDMSLSDALDVLDFTISGRFETWKSDFGIIAEGNYLGISDDQTVTLPGPIGGSLDASVEVEQYWLSLMAAYRFARGETASGNKYTFDVSGGVRYNSLDQDVRIKGPFGTQKLGGSESWVEPVIGFRGAINVSEDWSVLGIVDASGFGVEDNDLAWSASLIVDRQLNETTSLKFGYRYYSIDYETTKSDGLFGYEIEQHGPFIAMSYRF